MSMLSLHCTLELPLTADVDGRFGGFVMLPAETVLIVFNVSCRTPDQSGRLCHSVMFGFDLGRRARGTDAIQCRRGRTVTCSYTVS